MCVKIFKEEFMKKPIILCIMDGYGIAPAGKGNCVAEAKKPNLDRIFK